MGNGLPFNMICCNGNKEANNGDIDLNKSSKDNSKPYINFNTNNVMNKDRIGKCESCKLKKFKTHLLNQKQNEKNHNNYNRDSKTYKDPNISLFNNTFQILNNTQQYISFSNMNFFRNQLQNKNYKSYFNSKNMSSYLNLSKIKSGVEESVDIKTKLKLTGELFKNKTINIDKNGMINSLRPKHDDMTIFGYINANDQGMNPLIFDQILDLKLPPDQHQKHRSGRVFEIVLDKIQKSYMLFFLHNTFLLYYKISDSIFFEMDKDYFLILGEIFLTINVKRPINIIDGKIITIKVEVENNKTKKYSFNQKDVPIKIGRCKCNINIQKPSISKLHCTINFDNDMFFLIDNKSTNGSTLLIKEDDFLRIKGEMDFKLEDLSFKIIEINEG
jgi:hypothetical protein